MTTNTLLTPNIIAKESLLSLENLMVFSGLVFTDYKNEFKKIGDTVTVRKPATFTAIEFDGDLTGQYQNITEGSVDVKLDTILDVSFEVTAKELTLDVQSFRTQVLDPAMQAHSQALDLKLAKLFVDIPYFVAYDPTSDATKLGSCANSRAMLYTNKTPANKRYSVLDPTTDAGLLVVPSFLNAEKRGDNEALREGSLGRLLGIDWHLDQNIQTSVVGTFDLAGALTATEPVGETSLAVGSLGTGTIAKGSLITIAGNTGQYVVTAEATISGNAATVLIYPGLNAECASSAVVTIAPAAIENLVFHKNAFALVFRPLEPPMGGAKGLTVNWRGMAVRMTYDYDMNTKKNIISTDILCGVKTLTPELACRLRK